MKLNDALIAALKPRFSKKFGRLVNARYSDGRGLYIRVSKTGDKKWVFIYRDVTGTQREAGLGSYSAVRSIAPVSLKAARLAADRIRVEMDADKSYNPIEAKDAAKIAVKVAMEARTLAKTTFGEVMADKVAILKGEWKVQPDGTCEQEEKWVRSLKQHAAKLVGMPVAKITEFDVIAVLKPIWAKSTGERVRVRIETIMQLAIKRGLYTGANPASFENIKDEVGSKAAKGAAKGHASMPFAMLPAFWVDLMRGTGMATKALAFVILTAARTDEAREMRWSEIEGLDSDNPVWIVPAERMKMGKEHIVPLSKQAVALLRSIPRQVGNDYVFAGKKLGACIGVTALKDRLTDPVAKGGMGMAGVAAVHGFRATFRTWVSKRKLDEKAAEIALAHTIGTSTTRAYDRDDKLEERADLLQVWADFCTKPTVVQLKVAA